MNRLDMKSKDIINDNIEYIGQKFPNVIVESENGIAIDFDALKQELSNVIVGEFKEEYQLTWPGKKEAIVNANTPTTKTLRPLREKSVNFDTTKNVYIEGDNLEVLKILQESYLGKIKCIYIDPPYNTGNDFIYSDKFNKNFEQELLDSGKIDEEGIRLVANKSNNGRFHSDWLSMIYPRLKLSRFLLSDEGIIYVSVGNDEISNVRKILDDLFGENNFIAQLVWTNNEGGGSSDSKFFKVKHEYVLCYAKNIERTIGIKNVPIEDASRYKLVDEHVKERGSYQLVKLASASLQYSSSLDYPVIAPDGTTVYPKDNTDKDMAIWRWSEEKLKWGFENDFLEWKKDKKNNWQLYTKQYINCDKDGNIVERTKTPLGLIDKYSSTQGSNELFNLFKCRTFVYPKPTSLLKFLFERFSNQKDDIILDFFSGSSTTADAIMQLNAEDGINRKYILVQLPELCDEESEAYKNGYKNICDIGEERIRRAAKKIQEETSANIDYGFRVYKVDSSNMNAVYYMPDQLEQSQLNLFETNIRNDRTSEDLLTQVILDFGLTLDLEIEEKNILGNTVYFVDDNSLVACFEDNLNINIIDEIVKCKPSKVVFKDGSFKNDNDKINAEERLKKQSADTKLYIL